MARRFSKIFLAATLFSASLSSNFVKADANYPGIIGKDNWLYYNYEITTVADVPKVNGMLDTIRRFNTVLAANGIAMVATFVPIKMRVYPEFLPPTLKVNAETQGGYARLSQVLRAGQVNVIDINAPMMDAANKTKYAPYPLFLRLDRHWSPSGALVVADAIKAGIEANPALKKVYDATPVQAYKLEISKDKKTLNSHDLVGQLSPQDQASHNYPPESSLLFKAVRSTPGSSPSGIVVLGSSYSMEWTGFPDALRSALQRDITFSTAHGPIGPWYGAISYFSDESVQAKPPKLLILEMSERELHITPDADYREPRSRMLNSTDWLLRVSALVQQSCKASSVTGKIASTGLASKPGAQKSDGVSVDSTTEADFIDIDFNNPITKLDYIVAQLFASGVKTITLEASGPDTAPRKILVEVKGDKVVRALKYPLLSMTGKGYTKVRIYPGNTSGFSFQGLKVCRQPEDLLS